MNVVSFEPNQPQQFALRDLSPCKLPGTCGSLYAFTDGQLLHLGPSLAQSVADLKLQAGETFHVIQHQQENGTPYKESA